MEAPVVGMPTCLDERGRWRRGRRYSYIDCAYADAVSAAGGIPLQLPVQARAERLVERIDALLVPGGDDLLPPADVAAHYEADASFDPTPELQRRFDAELLQAALARGIPILAVCYGMQLAALEAGGQLAYHLPADLPEAEEHRLAGDARHAIEIEADSQLATLVGATTCEVNSRHHQAVTDPGAGYRCVARSRDGVIEAVERSAGSAGWFVGVQWHPESLAGSAGAGLFEALVAAAGAARPGGDRIAR